MVTKKLGFISVFIFLLLFFTLSFAETVNYTYDDAGRLIKAKQADGKTIEYTYDKAGNLLKRAVSMQAPDKDGGDDDDDDDLCFISTIFKKH